VAQLDRLSPRELEMFHSLGKGMRNKEIAKALGLSDVGLVRADALKRCTHGVAP